VEAAGRQLQRAARAGADQPAAGIERVEQREQVLLAGAAAVHQHERALGVACGRAEAVWEIVEHRAADSMVLVVVTDE
jgi:hypothetical protein